MYLHEIAMDSFIIVQADWPAEKARQAIERLRPTHVIVHRTEPQDYYYLYTQEEVLERLGYADDQELVHDAFGLHEYTATDTVDAYADAGATEGRRAVVLDEGRVAGFYDPRVRPGPPPTRGVTRGGVRGEPSAPVHRSLVADFPEQVPLQETRSLLVSLSAESVAGAALPLVLPVTATLDVVVQPKRGFVLVGAGEGSLVITGEEQTLPLQFKLRATEVGPGRIHVVAFHQGQPLGRITLAPTVVPAAQAVDAQRRSHEREIAPVTIRQPDLSLIILEQNSGGQPAFIFKLTAVDPTLELNFKHYGPKQLERDPQQYFTEFFEDIEDLPLRTSRDKLAAERKLALKGALLFEKLVPEDLQVLLWALQDRIQSVQVQSEEPWIPWELCKLQKKEDGRVVEGPFFCEAFAMTRWLLGEGLKPSLELKNMALILPKDSGLPFAPQERDYILSLGNGARKVNRIPATWLDVTDALMTGEYDGLHFTGHGRFAQAPNRSAMVLQEGDKLAPEDLSGEVKNLGLAQPFVFLNACQIGRSAMSLTDIGGWAAQFVRAGAAAFVGAYWSIYDRPALEFAEALYTHLLSDVPIGEAAKQARLAIKPQGGGDPTWLAYSVYAHPLAKVQS
jgi:hypothetical protein